MITKDYKAASLIGIRDTFGVVDPKTKKLYTDILFYAMQEEEYSQAHLFKRTVAAPGGTEYLLHMDSKLKRALRGTGLGDFIKVVVSYQQRIDCNIALARLARVKKEQ